MKTILCCLVLAAADIDYVSMLQTRAARRVAADGVCGLGVFTQTQAETDATLADMFDEFSKKCKDSYPRTLCKSLEEELFDGVDGDAKVANNPAVPKICQELSALILADLDHKELGAGNTVLAAGSMEGAVASKEGREDLKAMAKQNVLEETEAAVVKPVEVVPEQEAVPEKAEEVVPEQVQTELEENMAAQAAAITGVSDASELSEVNAKAVDDPHLTSLSGNHFDLYSTGKYTLLTVPRNSRSDSANLIVDAYVERIGDRKNDLWIRRLTIGGKWVGERYSFKTSNGEFGSDSTHLVRVGHGDWQSPEQVQKSGATSFRVLPTKSGSAPDTDFAQTNSKRVEVQCGPVSALVKWATVQKNGQDVNHIDFRMHGLHGLGSDVGGLLADEYDMDAAPEQLSLLNGHDAVVTKVSK